MAGYGSYAGAGAEDEQALLNPLQAAFGTPVGGGIQAPVTPAATPLEGTPTAGSPPTEKKTYAIGGYDPNKLETGDSEKYKFLRTVRQFDPNTGINADVLSALNALDIGDFSGSGDKLSVGNVRNGARWLPGMGDVITGFKGTGPKSWVNLDTPDPNKPDPAMAQGTGGGNFASLFGQDNGVPAPDSNGLFAQLMQQLATQNGTTDTNAALRAALR